MPSRLVESYKSHFRHLKAEVMRSTGQLLQPATIMTDFEPPIITSVSSEF